MPPASFKRVMEARKAQEGSSSKTNEIERRLKLLISLIQKTTNSTVRSGHYQIPIEQYHTLLISAGIPIPEPKEPKPRKRTRQC